MSKYEITFGKMKWKNPVTVASGTFGLEYAELFDLSHLGALTTKTLTPEPKAGNEPQRIVETEVGLLNSIGLQNPGVDEFIRSDLPEYRKFDTNLIVSVSASSVKEFVKMVKKLNAQSGIDAYEINVSCPNVENEGIAFGTDPEIVFDLTKNLREATERTLIIKLSPNVTSIMDIARQVEHAGADGLALINTLYGMAVDVETRKSKLHNIVGGYSGPAIKPIALQNVYKVAQAVKIPIIAMGGISSVNDALEFVIAGATAVAAGTYNFVNPLGVLEIIEGIQEYCTSHNIEYKNITGSLQT